jgi:hypothetical protein
MNGLLNECCHTWQKILEEAKNRENVIEDYKLAAEARVLDLLEHAGNLLKIVESDRRECRCGRETCWQCAARASIQALQRKRRRRGNDL